QTPRDGGRREEAPLVVRPEAAGAVGATGQRQQVPVLDVVVRSAEVREERRLAVGCAVDDGERSRGKPVDAEEIVGEARVARVDRLAALPLHGEAAEHLERVAGELATPVDRVLVDDVVVLARLVLRAALAGGAGRNRTR